MTKRETKLKMVEKVRYRYGPMAVLLIVVSLIFSALGGFESALAFWAIIAITVGVFIIVSTAERIGLFLRNFLRQLFNKKRQNK